MVPEEITTFEPPAPEDVPTTRLTAPPVPFPDTPVWRSTNPEFPWLDTPVLSCIMPDTPADSTLADVTRRVPEPELALVPVKRDTEPPTAADEVLPAATSTPPALLEPAPTSKLMSPPVDKLERPVNREIPPVLPAAELPDSNNTAPETPVDSTFVDRSAIDPVPLLALEPETRATLPPTAAEEVRPAESITPPPLPLAPVPTTNPTDPAVPLIAAAVETRTCPVFPFADEPVSNSTEPDTPDDSAFAENNPITPEPELALVPETTETEPPKAADVVLPATRMILPAVPFSAEPTEMLTEPVALLLLFPVCKTIAPELPRPPFPETMLT